MTTSSDLDFSRDLLTALDHERQALVDAPPVPRRSGLPRRLALSGATAVVIGGGLVLVASSGGGRTGPPTAPSPAITTPAGPSAPAPSVAVQPLTIAAVREQATAALDASSGRVIHLHEVRRGGEVVDAWWSGNDGEKARIVYVGDESEGGSHYDVGYATVDGVTTETMVDHEKQTVYVVRLDQTFRKHIVETPADLRERLASGSLRLVGPEVLDGRATIRLVDTLATAATLDVWVDATTFLTVRRQYVDASPRGVSTTMDYEWLDPTPAALANLDPVVPAAYARRDHFPDDTNADGSRG